MSGFRGAVAIGQRLEMNSKLHCESRFAGPAKIGYKRGNKWESAGA